MRSHAMRLGWDFVGVGCGVIGFDWVGWDSVGNTLRFHEVGWDCILDGVG